MSEVYLKNIERAAVSQSMFLAGCFFLNQISWKRVIYDRGADNDESLIQKSGL